MIIILRNMRNCGMIHLITGGSGSGKSAYAESRIQQFDIDRRYYIATMQPFDEESHAEFTGIVLCARIRDLRLLSAIMIWKLSR